MQDKAKVWQREVTGSLRSSSEKENGKKSPLLSNGASKTGSSKKMSAPAGQAVTPLVATSQKATVRVSSTSTKQPKGQVSLMPFAITTSSVSMKPIVPSVVEAGHGSNQDSADVATASIITETNQSGLNNDDTE